MRKKKALINIAFSILLEFVSILSGFVIPHVIISTFGSKVNGLTHSMASFMGYISVLQLGVGSVIKASLYKPLAQKDTNKLSVIVKASSDFFKKIGLLGIIYMMVLTVLFPFVIKPEFDFAYSASLVVIIGAGTIAQYLFGITYQMVLEADQRSYVYSIIQIVTTILNAVFVVLLAKFGCSIQLVKLASAAFFVLRPLVLSVYVKKRYSITNNVKKDNSIIDQRWDGFAHGLAYFIHSKTDVFVLTLFSTLENVSVYGVYAMITTGVTAFISKIDVAVRAAFGNIIAKNETAVLRKSFDAYCVLTHIFSCVCFCTACITVQNFILVYTQHIEDADYYQSLFSILIITAEMLYCLRMPYNGIIFANNSFRATKIPAFIEAGINILLSCILVQFWGLVGVAIGTMAGMAYRTIAFIVYLHKNIIHISYLSHIKRYCITFLAFFSSFYLIKRIPCETHDYLHWILYAAMVFGLVSIIVLLINLIFDYKGSASAIRMLIGKRRIKHGAK